MNEEAEELRRFPPAEDGGVKGENDRVPVGRGEPRARRIGVIDGFCNKLCAMYTKQWLTRSLTLVWNCKARNASIFRHSNSSGQIS